LTVVALCSVVAVFAVLVTQTLSPKGATGGGWPTAQGGATAASTDGDSTDAAPDGDGTPPDDQGDPASPSPSAAPAPAAPPADPAPPAAVPAPPARPGPRTTSPVPSPTPSPTPSPPPPSPKPVSYEAESATNAMPGARVISCSGCSGGKKVGYVGRDSGSLQFNGISAATAKTAQVTISYVNGDPSRTARLSVNGGPPLTLTFGGTGNWNTVRTLTVNVALAAGTNRLTFSNPVGPCPDFDRVTVLT
jgi:hypothetical protein